MHAGEREKVDSLDVLSSYLPSFTVTFGRLTKFHIGFSLKRKISSGELRGYFQMRFYISVGILTGFL
ncbi:hypothetical protein Goshw_021169 [Gossypium schwendimanii]|uniref:Uncharacterized protein n=1 Tax=Gossypium schwendimanii TaxID=34291 RepID=A0A7J9MXW0_GOSSC|nr:hypothetical protein [Gossypium schwendimanii]